MTVLFKDDGGSKHLSPWLIRIPAAVVPAAVLGFQFGRIDGFGAAVMYAASWIILLHVFIGEYVFIRCLHAVSRNQQLLDLFAGLLIFGGILTFRQSALWCAFLAGAFALAITKYLLIEQYLVTPVLKRYAQEKIRWESPAVCLFSVLAVLMDKIGEQNTLIQLIELSILIAAALFAFWMIGIRHVYRRVMRRSGETQSFRSPVSGEPR